MVSNIHMIIFFSIFSFALGQNETTSRTRKGKIFPIFSIVSFKNSQCSTTTDSTMRGTCYTASECSSRGGTASGNCASGFGVCCVFMVNSCGGTVRQNCTYILNEGYPTGFTPTTAGCTYTVSPVQSDICQLRLDFVRFETEVNTAVLVDNCLDTFTATTQQGIVYPVICGINTGLHMYLENGASTSPATLAFAFGARTTQRTWKIKVTQIECTNPGKAPEDCIQYFTGLSGTFQSYNFAGEYMLPSMKYTNCFRQEKGQCGIQYSESIQTATDPFYLGAPNDGAVGPARCSGETAMLVIPGDAQTQSTFCGNYLTTIDANTVSSAVLDSSSPFIVNVISTATTAATSVGFSLVYNQIPCN